MKNIFLYSVIHQSPVRKYIYYIRSPTAPQYYMSTKRIILFLSLCICYLFPISLSWKSLKTSNNRCQSKIHQRGFQINLLFSERFTDAIKECNSLVGFSTIPLPQEFSEIQGVIAKKQTISVMNKTTKTTNTKYDVLEKCVYSFLPLLIAAPL